MEPLVSIVMPAFNSELTINESIESVLYQTYSNWELLITDDCSTDKTANIAKQLCKLDSRIHFYSLDFNSGAGAARNNSIRVAKGRYIAFLDADDLWMNNKLELQVKHMQLTNSLLSYTAYQKFSAKGDGGVIFPKASVSYNELLYGNVIGCLTAMYDQHALGKRYMPLIRKRQDMGLWLDILKDIDEASLVPDVLAKYRIDSGMTQNKLTVLGYQWRFYRDVVKLGFLKSTGVFVVYGVKGLFKFLS
ncbi:glycosyltransferase family 2 protein [Shewanella fidelis]|uniref:glycosyltransferase family 2 protein n=1 Tax=Shewanella fidelis TaxID=173509 RepID=UPI00049118B3|nr:glycosyltransferase [Shewanella fidelis]